MVLFSGHFSLQDIQEILDSFDVLHHQVPPDDTDYHEVSCTCIAWFTLKFYSNIVSTLQIFYDLDFLKL